MPKTVSVIVRRKNTSKSDPSISFTLAHSQSIQSTDADLTSAGCKQ